MVLLLIAAYTKPALANISHDIEIQIEKYSNTYPDIQFFWLKGQEGLEQLLRLPALLGEGARNLDYEHDDVVRNILNKAQYHRISMMIHKQWPSATLFQTGNDSKLISRHACVITLDPDLFEHDHYSAMRLMIGDDITNLNRIPAEYQINNADFANFTLHHEIFHCLDAYQNGPLYPKSRDELGSLYSGYRAENRADIYATQTFLSEQSGDDRFLENFTRMRTLCVPAWDLTHCTDKGIQHSLDAISGLAANLSHKKIIDNTDKISTQAIPEYETFTEFLACAYRTAINLGNKDITFTKIAAAIESFAIDDKSARRMENKIKHIQTLLFSDNSTQQDDM